MLTDTHCHIHAAQQQLSERDYTTKKWHEAEGTNPDKMIADAEAAGVSRFVCVGTDITDSATAIEFVGSRSNCWASVGVHPHEAKDFRRSDLATVRKLLKQDKVVAIGEVGLDYYYEHSTKEQQVTMLEEFLQVAQDNKLPLIFHVREAYSDFWSILNNFNLPAAVLHSFAGSETDLEQALNRGFYIGLNGIMTFTKDNSQLTISKSVPLNRLLLETDAPYLTPKPFRGKICKPEYVREVAEFVADLRGETLEQLANATTANATRLFKLQTVTI